jgi:AcrR family transcriptional regulator
MASGTQLRRGLVEAEILERGAELFAARGFAATSMQDIADALGSSRPALYHYFSSKDEILDRLIEGLAAATEAALSSVEPQDGPADARLRDLVTALIKPVAESPGRFRLILTSDATVSSGARGRLKELERTVVRALSEVLDDGMASGTFRRADRRTATFAVLGMINWVAWWYSPGRDVGTDELCAVIADLAVGSVRADTGVPGGAEPKDVIGSIRRDLSFLERLVT